MPKYQKPAPLNIDADKVWGAACQAQRVNGAYVKFVLSESDLQTNKISNRQIVENLLVDPTQITEEDMEQGRKVRAFYQGFTFKILKGIKLNEFDNTAMLLANREMVDSKYDIAVIASLPSCYERGVKRQTVDQRINFARGGFIGKVGNKVSANVEVVKSVYSQKWNTFYITGITSDEQVVFFAYKQELQIGQQRDIYGTVKAHRDNITQLNRVKII